MMNPEFAHFFSANNKKLKYYHGRKQTTQYPSHELPPFLILMGGYRWLTKLTNNISRVSLGTKLVHRNDGRGNKNGGLFVVVKRANCCREKSERNVLYVWRSRMEEGSYSTEEW